MVKLLTLVFISIAGLVVLGGHTRVSDTGSNFAQPFKGTITPYGATTALYRIILCRLRELVQCNQRDQCTLSRNEHNACVLRTGQNPIKTTKKNSFVALLLVTSLYLLANVAYFAAGQCIPTVVLPLPTNIAS